MQKPIFTALSDGTHIHNRNWGDEYCKSRDDCPYKRKKPLPVWAKNIIVIQTFINFILISHLILKANNL